MTSSFAAECPPNPLDVWRAGGCRPLGSWHRKAASWGRWSLHTRGLAGAYKVLGQLTSAGWRSRNMKSS